MASYTWPAQGSGGGVPIYSTFGVFPSGSQAGDLAVAADTGILYEWDGAAWQAIAGPGSILVVGTIDTGTASLNGAQIITNQLIMQSASATRPGLVNNTTQTMSGNKTFSGNVIVGGTLNVTGTTTLATSLTGILKATSGVVSTQAVGDLTDAGTDGIVITGGTGVVIGSGTSIAQHVADTTHNGYLSSTDWNTFNGKQASGNYITALTGDVTASGPGSVAATLATVNGNVGSFTYSSITVNGKGLITAAASGAAPVTTLAAVGAVPNANAATISGNTLNLQPADGSNPGVVTTGAQTMAGAKTFSGGVIATVTGTASGNTTYSANNHGLVISSATNAMTVLAPDASTAKTLISGGASADPAWGTLAIGGGGTGQVTKAAAFDALSPMNAGGQLIYGGASGTGTALANGSAGDILKSAGTTAAPAWYTSVIGTYVESIVSTGTNFPTSGQFGDATSISLTAGDWEVTAVAQLNANGSTVNSISIGISTTSGNSSTGLTVGNNRFSALPPTSSDATSVSVPCFRAQPGSTTTYYLKIAGVYSVATPQFQCRLSARKWTL